MGRENLRSLHWQNIPSSMNMIRAVCMNRQRKEMNFFVDEIDEEIQEIFYINVAYIQLLVVPDTYRPEPQLIVKSETLEDRRLPFSQHAYQALQDSPYWAETITTLFSFPLRVLSLQVHDMEGHPYILQLGMSLQDIQITFTKFVIHFWRALPCLTGDSFCAGVCLYETRLFAGQTHGRSHPTDYG